MSTSSTVKSVQVRPASEEDHAAIVDIYNHYVMNSPCTFDIEPFTLESRKSWFDQFSATGRHRLFVAVDGADRVVGYTCTTSFKPKAAYAPTVETSVYCVPEQANKGVGAALYRKLFEALADEDIHRALAGIALPNDASLALHERFGFMQVALFSEVGRKFGRYWDVAWFEKKF